MNKIFSLSAMALLLTIPSVAAFGSSLPDDTEASETLQTQSCRPCKDADPNLGGEWVFYNIYGQKITGDDRPNITIDLASGKFYGSNGCNIINGYAVTGKDNALKFTDMASTRMYCPDAQFEHLINKSLEDVAYYKVSQYGHEFYLDLLNARRQTIIVMRKHNMDFLNGAWQLEKVSGTLVTNPAIEFVIDIPQKRIHGNTGCNIMNGNIFIDNDKSNSIQFDHLATTKRACRDSNLEMAILVAFEEVESAYAIGNNEVRMTDKNGNELMLLRRISVR